MPSDDLDQIAAELYNDLGLHEVCILEDEPAILAAIADALRHQRAAGEQVMHVAWSAKLAEAQQQIEALTAGAEANDKSYVELQREFAKLAGELAATEATGRAEARAEWQPIATAPKDGRSVVLWWPYWSALRAVVGWWTANNGWQANEVLEGESEPPTHWMPLPAAPEETR